MPSFPFKKKFAWSFDEANCVGCLKVANSCRQIKRYFGCAGVSTRQVNSRWKANSFVYLYIYIYVYICKYYSGTCHKTLQWSNITIPNNGFKILPKPHLQELFRYRHLSISHVILDARDNLCSQSVHLLLK